ncbi:MAG TPA: peptidoglycan DD-metalloendopeptidase family protein [Candidatus Paceibacterota bacterium]
MRLTALLPILAAVFFLLPVTIYAQVVAELQQQINQHNTQIDALNKEIAQYEAQLKTTQAAKNTLQNKVNQLDLQRKKLSASISVTKNQIGTTQLQIQQLASGIATREISIGTNKAGLMESLRRLDEAETQPMAISILASDSVSDVWEDVDAIFSMREAVRNDIQMLSLEKRELTDTKTQTEQKKAQLVKQQSMLTAQQGSLDATRKAQNELLAVTKSQESSYQKILSQKQAEKEQFEAALFQLASQLQYNLDPSSVPPIGKGVLRWPLDEVRITQQFGRTSDSRRLYTSGTHDGIDFSTKTASNGTGIGTPVKAALAGVVLEVNHGAVQACQYGKWVLIRHGNGLATLYAHLSDIRVQKGQSVGTGTVVGYSGETGYATGPHLHFTVYQAAAVTFKQYKCKSGKTVTIPIAPLQAYLNPMDYL